MQIVLRGATDQVARDRAVRKALVRIDVEKADLIHKYTIYLDVPEAFSIDSVKLLEHTFIDIRIYSVQRQLYTSFQMKADEILSLEVI